MSQENVEGFKRGIEAYNRGDVEALLDELDAEIEWRPVLPVLLGGDTTVYRGHDGIRKMLRDLDEVLAERQLDFSDIRAAGERVVATGRLRISGRTSGVPTESPFGWVAEFKNGKSVRIQTYLDPNEALASARRTMLDHMGFEVSDYERSKAFYTDALKPLGLELLMEPAPGAGGFGLPVDQKPFFWISGRGHPAVSGVHVAFEAPSTEVVDAFYAAALAAGGQDNGAPGKREIYHPGYYGAYVLDPDGNNVEAVFHRAP